MHRVRLQHLSVRPRNPFAGWEWMAHRVATVLFVTVALLVWADLWLPLRLFHNTRWPDGLLLVLTAATTLTSLSRQLPAQNVVLASFVIGLFAGAAHVLGVLTSIPFGPLAYNKEKIGRLLFYPLPGAIPLIWVILLLNARGVARLILRRWRRAANYGLWVLALTAVLVVVFDASLEPYATQVRGYWSWKPTKIPSDWYSTPWVNFLGWGVSSGLILVFVTPALVNKSPVTFPPTYHPLLVWETLSLLLLTGVTMHHLRAAAIVTGGQMVIIAILSVLGARSGSKQSEALAR